MAEFIKRKDICNLCNNQNEFCGKEKCPVYRAPKSDVALVRYGMWKYYHKQRLAVCTECSFERKLDDDFGEAVACPNCGARMDGGANNETD